MTLAAVKLWGKTIGAISWDDGAGQGNFEYDKKFIQSGIEVSPVKMPLSDRIYTFPALKDTSFHGLPGLVADSLPDKFGNALIDAWLAREGRQAKDFNPVERLCYMGRRGMGALEFEPTVGPRERTAKPVDVAALVELASEILTKRDRLKGSFDFDDRKDALNAILQVGTSAGGARAKAVIAWNETTNEIRSGQVNAGDGFDYWLIKFDGVTNNRDKELADPQGYGKIEYAYSKVAKTAGITMSECRLLQENGRSHFMTKRFDRGEHGEKYHMQTFAALEHYDFNLAGAYSYEQVFQTMRKLKLPMRDIEEQFRRMVFNIIARNQDDHVKNIAFLMNKAGVWSLSPAYDVTYSYNPKGDWTAVHQMTLGGKQDDFTLDDFVQCAKLISMKKGRAEQIAQEVTTAVKAWPKFAQKADVDERQTELIKQSHRLALFS